MMIHEIGELSAQVLEVEAMLSETHDWSLIKQKVASVYSGLCLMAWKMQELEESEPAEFSRHFSDFTVKLEDLVLLYAARLKREPPDWVLRCSHD